jgi:hypothetical protein
MTIFSLELTVFLGYKDLQLLTDLIDWYNSVKNPWVHKTIQGGAQEIPGVWVNLLGATTPDLLRTALPLEAIGGGLISRMLLIYAKKKGQKIDSEFKTDEELELKKKLHLDLLDISRIGGEFTIDPKCKEFYINWYHDYNEEKECQDDRFAGYFERKPTTLRKLSIILSASRSNDKIIQADDLKQGLELLKSVESVMYYSLHGIGKNPQADTMEKIMTEIALRKECSVPHLMKKFRDDVSRFELENILKALDLMKYCTIYENTGKIVFIEEFKDTTEEKN